MIKRHKIRKTNSAAGIIFFSYFMREKDMQQVLVDPTYKVNLILCLSLSIVREKREERIKEKRIKSKPNYLSIRLQSHRFNIKFIF